MAARILLCSLLISTGLQLQAQEGAAVYKKYCASCHDAAGARVPGRDLLRLMSPERILLTLESGSMVMQGSFRTAAERRALSEFLAGKPLGSERATAPSEAAFCKPADGAFKDPFRGPHWNGWG